MKTLRGATGGPPQRDARSGRLVTLRSFAEKPDGGAVSVQRSDIDVGLSGTHAYRLAPLGQVRIDQRSEILVLAAASKPQAAQCVEDSSRHLECSPDPL